MNHEARLFKQSLLIRLMLSFQTGPPPNSWICRPGSLLERSHGLLAEATLRLVAFMVCHDQPVDRPPGILEGSTFQRFECRKKYL